MTLHAIWGFVAPDSGMTDSAVQVAIDDWAAKRVKWDGGYWDGTVERVTTEAGPEFLWMTVRFTTESDAKDNVLQKFGDKFKNKVDWFRVLYHECVHDDVQPFGDCFPNDVWEEKRTWSAKDVAVPSAVAANVPDAETVVQH